MYPATVALSPESVTVLLYASQLLEIRRNWLDLQDDPADTVDDEDWDEIEKLVANMVEEVLTPMIGYCFPVVLGGIPDNCLPLDGGTHAREDYPLLFDLLDDAFVLDADTFFLPDFRSRVPVGAGTGTGLSTFNVGEVGGEETHTLTELEMPSHYHTTNETQILAVAPGEAPVNAPIPLPLGTTNSAGGGLAHNNLQPFVGILWAVVAL